MTCVVDTLLKGYESLIDEVEVKVEQALEIYHLLKLFTGLTCREKQLNIYAQKSPTLACRALKRTDEITII